MYRLQEKQNLFNQDANSYVQYEDENDVNMKRDENYENEREVYENNELAKDY